jgi:5'-deoxynucleotidase YfbR-like HD superfamily hydrolase
MRDRKDVFTTATGRVLYVLEPDPSQICIEDIARSASRVCRFNGHVRPDVEFYGVAQHAVLVSFECLPVNAAIGLMHDAAEAYTQDVIRPLKHALGDGYAQIERAWTAAVDEAFGMGGRLLHMPTDVKRADMVLLAAERRDLCVLSEHDGWVEEVARDRPERIVPLLPFTAYSLFMRRFGELFPRLSDDRFVTPSVLGSLIQERP